MANLFPFINRLGAVGQGYFNGQDQLLQRQILQQRLKDQQLQDQGLAALADAYGNMPPPMPPGQMPGATPPQLPGMPQQGPQPPMPGQGSQPMMPPRQMRGPMDPNGMPPPPQAMQGGMPVPPQMRPQPPQMGAQGPQPQGGGQQQLPPYTGPQAPPQPPQPQMAIPKPPGQDPASQAVQSSLPDLETMASTLKKQGITGMALYQALQAHSGFLSTQGKAQLAQLTLELKQSQAESQQLKAQAAMRDADTKAAGEKRRGAHESGDTPLSQAIIEHMKAQAYSAVTRANKAATGGQSSVSSEDFQILAQGLVSHDISPKDLSIRGGLRERAIAEAKRIDPEYDSKEYNAQNAFGTSEARSVGSNLGKVEFAIQDMQEIAPLIMQASTKVPRTKFVPVNELITKFNNGLVQDPDQRELAIYINSMLNSYDMLASRGGTDKEKRAAVRGLLMTADTPDALQAGVKAFMNEAKAAERAGVSTKKVVTGGRKGAEGAAPTGPKKGDIEGGYRFKGGDPKKPENWEKV